MISGPKEEEHAHLFPSRLHIKQGMEVDRWHVEHQNGTANNLLKHHPKSPKITHHSSTKLYISY